jgi:prepilin-type N-terminal cleavage/methylation domain-containing protein
MKKYIKNDNGLTLVELLAVLAIGSIILILISNVHLIGQKQYKSQSENANSLNDVTYAMKVITKEIRKAKNPQWINEHEIILDEINYKFDNNEKAIKKAGITLIADIEEFKVTKRTDKGWVIVIKSIYGKKIKTEIVFRKGD